MFYKWKPDNRRSSVIIFVTNGYTVKPTKKAKANGGRTSEG